MQLTPETFVADIATHNPSAIAVLQRHGIDFCCGGRRSMAEVCRDRGLDLDALREEIAAATATDAPEREWTDATLAELIGHIVTRYHGRLREELPRLAAMAERVLAVHGKRHPEVLPALVRTFNRLCEELELHTAKEERVLFPWIEQLERYATGGSPRHAVAGMPASSVGAPIAMMESEHDEAAGALSEMRRLTGDYQLPDDACATFRGLYHGLAELEDDLHRHIHLENNVLFPRALALESS